MIAWPRSPTTARCGDPTETEDIIRPISFRRATTRETVILFEKIADNFRRLRSMRYGGILLRPEHPEASVKHIMRGVVRNGLRVIPPKRSVSLRIDADVLGWFKAQGAG